MYAIRASDESDLLEAVFSGSASLDEILRAVSQAFSLAEAGGIVRAICDVRDIEAGLTQSSLPLIAAAFTVRFSAGQRVAVLCTPEQLPFTRRFARFARIGEELGVFTRRSDAEEWLARTPPRRLSETVLRHMMSITGEREVSLEHANRESQSA